MSRYVNGFEVNVSDTARINFREQDHHGDVHEVTQIVMNYDTLKMLVQCINSTIQEYEGKLTKIAEDKRLAN